MKKFLYVLVWGFLMSSCGGDDPNPEPIPEPENRAPNKPSIVAPSNNSLCIDSIVLFEWNASIDPDGDAVNYELQVAEDQQFYSNMQARTVTTTSTSIDLSKGVAYYWRIRALDAKGAKSDFSTTYNFYTEGEGESNHLPFSPALVSPELNATVQNSSVVLEWTASDADVSDVLTFDIYFDTVNPPQKIVSENQSEMSLTQSMESSKTYYWKVIVKDDKGGEAVGSIWTFHTD